MTDTHEYISFTRAEGRATITLHRPPLNILNISMLEEINRTLAEVRADEKVKVLLLRGEGRCFSAGVDVADHLPDKVGRMLDLFHQTFDLLAALEIPTISAVHGATLGGGLELAVFTDMTFASAGATLGQPEIQLSVFPPLAAAYFPQLIGAKRSFELILTGKTVTAEQARQMGLVNVVFPEEEFAGRVDDIVRTVAGHSRPILLAAKRAIREALVLPFSDALSNAERIYLEDVMTTEDAKEGLAAFQEKRAPQWKDR